MKSAEDNGPHRSLVKLSGGRLRFSRGGDAKRGFDCIDHVGIRHHIDGVVVSGTAKVTFPRSRRVTDGYAQPTTDALVYEDSTNPAVIFVLLFNNAVLHRAGSLAD